MSTKNLRSSLRGAVRLTMLTVTSTVDNGQNTLNGRAALTQMLAAARTALDAGDLAFAPPPPIDQTGTERVYNGCIDIGVTENRVKHLFDWLPIIPNLSGFFAQRIGDLSAIFHIWR